MIDGEEVLTYLVPSVFVVLFVCDVLWVAVGTVVFGQNFAELPYGCDSFSFHVSVARFILFQEANLQFIRRGLAILAVSPYWYTVSWLIVDFPHYGGFPLSCSAFDGYLYSVPCLQVLGVGRRSV